MRTLVRKTYTLIGTEDTMRKLEGFLAFLAFNGGHSGLFAMPFDGDGHERLRVECDPPISKELSWPMHAISGAGLDIEIALDHGRYEARRLVPRVEASIYRSAKDGLFRSLDGGKTWDLCQKLKSDGTIEYIK